MGRIQRPPSHALDEYLVIECQLGNAEAFSALVRRWHAQFVRRAYKLTKDREASLDVVQESWIGIVRGLPRLRDPGRFHAWAVTIVTNKARDWIRREQSRRGVAADLRMEGPESPLGGSELERVRDGLGGLEPGQRVILRWHYLDGRSVAEIASELGVPEGTVKSRLSNARNQLRLRLAKED